MSHSHQRVHGGPIVLDLGDGIGALIVHADAALAGREIEVERLESGQRTHTEVHRRYVDGGTVFAGVFPELEEGPYLLLNRESVPRCVTIRGGEVTETRW